jgi:hypothetical protein
MVVSIVIVMDHKNDLMDKMNMELNNDDMKMDWLLDVMVDNHLSQAKQMDQCMSVVMMVVDKDVDECDDDDV